jgi:hypothetical protein
MATFGQQDVRNPSSSYTTQATFGSLFKSQESTLWTEDQNSDLKFRLNRAVFDNSDAGATVRVVNNNLANSPLSTDPFTFVHGSNRIRVSHKDHGFSSGDTIRLFSNYWAGQFAADQNATIQGVPLDEIFGNYLGDTTYYIDANANPGTLTVSDVTVDAYTVSVTTPAVITGGTTGLTYVTTGGNDIVAQNNVMYQMVKPTVSLLSFQPTQLTFEAQMARAFTYDTNSNNFASYGKFTKPLNLNNYNILDSSCIVLSDTVESNASRFTPTVVNTGGISSPWTDSFIGTIRMNSSTDHVSPAIEMSTFTLNTAGHRIDNPTRDIRLPVALPHDGSVDRNLIITTIANSSTTISFDGSSRKINSTQKRQSSRNRRGF